MKRAIWMCGWLACLCCAQNLEPRFEAYPVREVFRGTPAEPKLVTSWARHYRTRIRQGVEKGWGVRHGDKHDAPGPNFAGHYMVITWGCGTGCIQMVIVNAKNGRVHPPPLGASSSGYGRIALRSEVVSYVKFDYRVDSRLFMMHDCPKGWDYRKRLCDDVYFTMERSGFRFLRRLKGEPIEEVKLPLNP